MPIRFATPCSATAIKPCWSAAAFAICFWAAILQDYDVCTDATPDRVISLFPESVAVGAQFGVILIPLGTHKVEVATFRSDIGSADGRHPERVVFSSSAEQDVQRRDFTINGLLMRHTSGEILDFVEGQR